VGAAASASAWYAAQVALPEFAAVSVVAASASAAGASASTSAQQRAPCQQCLPPSQRTVLSKRSLAPPRRRRQATTHAVHLALAMWSGRAAALATAQCTSPGSAQSTKQMTRMQRLTHVTLH